MRIPSISEVTAPTHPTAGLFVLSHRPAPVMTERQTRVRTGIEAVAAPGVTDPHDAVVR